MNNYANHRALISVRCVRCKVVACVVAAAAAAAGSAVSVAMAAELLATFVYSVHAAGL